MYRVAQKTKLSYFVHIFTKYWPIFTIFSPADSVRNLLLSGMHTTPTMSLHYLVKHIYPKTNTIIHSLVVTSSVMGQFQEIPLLSMLTVLTVNCSMQLTILCTCYDDVYSIWLRIIDKQNLLATPVWERWPTETCFGGWVKQTVADIQEHRWMETSGSCCQVQWRTYWTSFQIIWTILLPLIYHSTFCCMILLVFGYLCFTR